MSGRKSKSGFIIGCLLLFLVAGLRVKAAESTITGTLQQVTKDVEVKEEADQQSATVGDLQQGTAVIVEDSEGSWSKVTYQEIEGYIPNDALQTYNAEQVESLDQEFQNVGAESIRIVDEHELKQKDKRSSVMWGIIIAVLVAGIFGVGIVSSLKKDKGSDDDSAPNDKSTDKQET